MEICYEYLGCDKQDCVMRKIDDKHCWEVDGTLCNHLGIELTIGKFANRPKEEACAHSYSIYYKAAKELGIA